jgi:glucokinase
LKTLAAGGVYIGGGIAPRILPFLEEGAFLAAFRRKGRMSDLLFRMPVHVILEPRAPLIGAVDCIANG